MSKYQEMTSEEKEKYKRERREYYNSLSTEEKEKIRIQRKERRKKYGKPQKEKEANKRWSKKNRERFQKEASELKKQCVELKGGKCQTCKNVFHPCAFDFHHRDPSEKEERICILIKNAYGKLTEKLKNELDKCDLLCANCHRIFHYAS